MSKRPLTKNLMSSRAKNLNIYQDALSMNAHVLLHTLNNFNFSSFLSASIPLYLFFDNNHNNVTLKFKHVQTTQIVTCVIPDEF